MSADNGAPANEVRRAEAAARTVPRAQAAIAVLAHTPLEPDRFHSEGRAALRANYVRVLQARVDYPDANLGQVGARLGMSKDAYAGRLRRAFRYAAWVSRQKMAGVR